MHWSVQKWGIFILLIRNLASESTDVVDNEFMIFPMNNQLFKMIMSQRMLLQLCW